MHLAGEATIRAADFLLLLVAHLEQVALAVFRIGRRYLLTGSLGVQPSGVFLNLLARIAGQVRRVVELALQDLGVELFLGAGGLRHAAIVIVQPVQIRRTTGGRYRASG